MPTHVYANNNEVASKAADGKSIAAFPDVCFSPPAPPVGPMPLPYPNTGEVKDTDSGTAKVFVKDKMSGMGDDSHMTKSMGDEPATKNFNKGMITGALQGKCYFGLWSMDVQMEGKGVPRHLDMVTHNHASKPDNGASGKLKDEHTLPNDATIENTCKVTPEMIKKVFTNAEFSDEEFEEIAQEVTNNMRGCHLDSRERLEHFFAQLCHESGRGKKLRENLNYTSQALRSKFGKYYTESAAKMDGRIEVKGKVIQKANQEKIANTIYSGRIGNGNSASGDGWRYIGRGFIQLTGKYNYIEFTKFAKIKLNSSINFVVNPEKLVQPKYGMQSALFFWENKKMYNALNDVPGTSNTPGDKVDRIASIVNPNEKPPLQQRRDEFNRIHNADIFKDVSCNSNTCKVVTSDPAPKENLDDQNKELNNIEKQKKIEEFCLAEENRKIVLDYLEGKITFVQLEEIVLNSK